MGALEHRLEATETALLRIISVVDEANLRAAFHSEVRTNHSSPRETERGLSVESRKGALVAFWDERPMATPEEILDWAKTVLNDGSPRRLSHEINGTTVPGNPQHNHHHVQSNSEEPSRPLEQAANALASPCPSTSQGPQEHIMSEAGNFRLSQHDPSPGAMEATRLRDSEPHNDGQLPSNSQPEVNETRLGVPLEFQRLYVW